jgi:hypothetical protein
MTQITIYDAVAKKHRPLNVNETVPQELVPATQAELNAGTAGKLIDAALAKANFLSKTGTTAQTMASDVNWAAGSEPYWGGSAGRCGLANGFQNIPNKSGSYLVSDLVGDTGVPPVAGLSGSGWWVFNIDYGAAGYDGMQLAVRALPSALPNVLYSRASRTGPWQPLGGGLGINQTYLTHAAAAADPNLAASSLYIVVNALGNKAVFAK